MGRAGMSDDALVSYDKLQAMLRRDDLLGASLRASLERTEALLADRFLPPRSGFTVRLKGTRMLKPQHLRHLLRSSRKPKRSEERGLDLPDAAWQLLDDGAELMLHENHGPFVIADGALAWPTEGKPAAYLVDRVVAEYEAKRAAGGSAEVEWSGEWPVEPGFYWFFGRRAEDRLSEPPGLHAAQAQIMVESFLTADGERKSREFLLVTSDGRPVVRGQGFTHGMWAPIQAPDEDELPIDMLASMPPPDPQQGGAVVHCVRAGQSLCGAQIGPGATVARVTQLALISCPTCRAQAERVG